ncbi:ZIP family metal transporter [Candidatus Woesearchaeota archaeon]|nr:ZIP family metal transporter [Candidatus Woesearchaeota archaeon]
MLVNWIYALASVLIVSSVSFVGILIFPIKTDKLKKMLIYMVSFSAGALFGDVFVHLLPETVQEYGFGLMTSLYLIFGIIISFSIEKFVHWRHCHIPTTREHIHPFAMMNLFGDSVHNFIDGLIIGASYLVSIPVGIATTIAIILHELPQEIGDFGVLLHGGFTKSKALFFNFITALTAVLGAILFLIGSYYFEDVTQMLIPFAAGTFIYIAGSDLIPELHKEVEIKKSMMQLIAIILGVSFMFLLLLV